MRVNVVLILIASICALTGLSHPSPRTSDRAIRNLEWGQPSEGLQMSLEATDTNRAELQAALRNTGDHDVTLNLGHMMANGKVQLPNNIELNFTDPQGKSRVFGFADKNHGFVGGRLDDYVVPLRAGSMYTLKLALDQFWCPETKEFAIPLGHGASRLRAQFQGTGARLVNLDMPAIKLMNFWLGKVQSNLLTIER
jgi:hypothetical protein